MAKVFVSYSSSDRTFAQSLALHLENLGHRPWFDEWEIKVGEAIETKIEGGIEDADFVVVVLSPRGTASNWVDKEWKAKYWEEVNKNQVLVLPLLLEDCSIPILLRNKRYADFRSDREKGLVQLYNALKELAPDPGQPKSVDVRTLDDRSPGIPEEGTVSFGDLDEIDEQIVAFQGLWHGSWKNSHKRTSGAELVSVRSQEGRRFAGIFYEVDKPEIRYEFMGTYKMGFLRIRYQVPKGQQIMEDGSCFLKRNEKTGKFEGFYANFGGSGKYTLRKL